MSRAAAQSQLFTPFGFLREQIHKEFYLLQACFERPVADLPFFAQFWNGSNINLRTKFLSQDMTDFLHDGKMTTGCPLHKYRTTTCRTSPKLQYIGKIPSSLKPAHGKVLILTEFVLVVYFAKRVSLSRAYLPEKLSYHRILRGLNYIQKASALTVYICLSLFVIPTVKHFNFDFQLDQWHQL